MRSIRAAFLALIAFAPDAWASEGLQLLGDYLCNAGKFTEALVAQCTDKHPDLAAENAAAYKSWHERNADAAARAHEFCRAEARKAGQDFDQLQADALRAIRLKAETEADVCRALPAFLQEGTDVEKLLRDFAAPR